MSRRSRPIWSRTQALTTTPVALFLPEGWDRLVLTPDAEILAGLGRAYAPPAVAAVNGILTITELGAPTGGTFQLTLFPGTDLATNTGDIAYDASAATIKTAITTTSKFAAGDITAGGGALNAAAVTLTFTGVYAATLPPIIPGSNALTGGSGMGIQVRRTTLPAGNGSYGYLPANLPAPIDADMQGGNGHERFLYVATVASTGNVRVTAYD